MVQDFKYVRESLKETTDNGRRVLQSVTLDLLSEDDESRASLITSFAELNRAVADNMKLYMQSYKDISTVILNLDKVKRAAIMSQPNSVTNNNLIVTAQKKYSRSHQGIKSPEKLSALAFTFLNQGVTVSASTQEGLQNDYFR